MTINQAMPSWLCAGLGSPVPQVRKIFKTLSHVAVQPGRCVVIAREDETKEGLAAPTNAQ